MRKAREKEMSDDEIQAVIDGKHKSAARWNFTCGMIAGAILASLLIGMLSVHAYTSTYEEKYFKINRTYTAVWNVTYDQYGKMHVINYDAHKLTNSTAKKYYQTLNETSRYFVQNQQTGGQDFIPYQRRRLNITSNVAWKTEKLSMPSWTVIEAGKPTIGNISGIKGMKDKIITTKNESKIMDANDLNNAFRRNPIQIVGTWEGKFYHKDVYNINKVKTTGLVAYAPKKTRNVLYAG